MRLLKGIFFILFLCPVLLHAQDIFPDKTDNFVNDYAQILGKSNAELLEQRLLLFSDSTTNQIVVVTVSDLYGYAASDYAQRLGQKWGVGHGKYNNGVVILLKPRNENGKGSVFIATGYGVEGALTDVRVGNIIDTYMMPYLQESRYFDAVWSAVDQIQPIMDSEYSEKWTSGDVRQTNKSYVWLVVMLFLLAVGLYFFYNPSVKTRVLVDISNSKSVYERDKAVALAKQLGIKQRKINKAVAKIPFEMLNKMRLATTKSQFESLVSDALLLGISHNQINNVRNQMLDITINNIKKCRDIKQLDALKQTARDFGNSNDVIENAVLTAIAAIAATTALSRIGYRGNRFQGGSSFGGGGSWHSGFGGGNFGGGGAGRSF